MEVGDWKLEVQRALPPSLYANACSARCAACCSASFFDRPVAVAASAFDFKSALQERLQARGLGLPEYRVAAERGPEHDKVFEVEVRVNGDLAATATGRSKKDAEQQAAQRALQAFA